MRFMGGTCSFIVGLCFPAFLLVLEQVADQLARSSSKYEYDFAELRTWCLVMTILGAVTLVFCWFQLALLGTYADRVCARIHMDYFSACLEKDASFYDAQDASKMYEKILEEVQAIRQGIMETYGYIVQYCTACVAYFAIGIWRGWLLGCLLLPGVPVIFCACLLLAIAMNARAAETIKAYNQSGGLAKQALAAIQIVHSYGNTVLEYSNYERHLGQTAAALRRRLCQAALALATVYALIYFFFAYALFVGSYLRMQEIKDTGNGGKLYSGGQIACVLLAILLASFDLGTAVAHIQTRSECVQAALAAFQVIDLEASVALNSGGRGAEELEGGIALEAVSFAYPSKPNELALRDFSLVIEAGKTVALFGLPGSGKSTIISLIERFYAPESGEITIDGTKLEAYDLRALRRRIGYVGQEPVVFGTTVRQNLAFSKPDAAPADMEAVLKSVNAFDFLKDGLDTVMQEGSTVYSASQLQRLAIARALLKKPKLLLLDEATSALSAADEAVVQQAIADYRSKHGSLTVVTVAFSQQTIKQADKIVVMAKGAVAEMGSHDDILQNHPSGIYAEFCQKQGSSD